MLSFDCKEEIELRSLAKERFANRTSSLLDRRKLATELIEGVRLVIRGHGAVQDPQTRLHHEGAASLEAWSEKGE